MYIYLEPLGSSCTWLYLHHYFTQACKCSFSAHGTCFEDAAPLSHSLPIRQQSVQDTLTPPTRVPEGFFNLPALELQHHTLCPSPSLSSFSLFHFMHVYMAGGSKVLIQWTDERMFAETMDPAPGLHLSSSRHTFRLSFFDFFKADTDIYWNFISPESEILCGIDLPRARGALGNSAS